jgi:hypothetical protein
VAAGTEGLLLIDVMFPGSPSIVGQLNTIGTARDVVVRGDRVYVAADNGLKIIDTGGSGGTTRELLCSRYGR